MLQSPIKSVAIVGAGAAGAVTAAAFAAEECYDIIRVFERKETPGGTWIYDSDPGEAPKLQPGRLPPEIDKPLDIPPTLPTTKSPSEQYRWDKTPIYAELTPTYTLASTNVPEIAMSFSDTRFPYGPFVPHWVPKQYIQDYFTRHKIDSLLVLNTTVEDISMISPPSKNKDGQFVRERWKLTLRKYDAVRKVDDWWEEIFDAVILANGHYSVPYIPSVSGLSSYINQHPKIITHSKSYRTASLYTSKTVLVIGNSASGHDITTQLLYSGVVDLPIYQSRRSSSRWDGAHPPPGIVWKPIITEYRAATREIVFEDGSVLRNIDAVIYCTGYKPSFPFWNHERNGRELFDYRKNHLRGFYQHTFSVDHPGTVGIVGIPRVLTFRSFEYQAVALARLFSGRTAFPLPSRAIMEGWEKERAALVTREKRKFHDVQWDNGETMGWFEYLYDLAGLPRLEGEGRYPPVLGKETRWAIENVKKYPEPGKQECYKLEEDGEEDWILVHAGKDSLHFI